MKRVVLVLSLLLFSLSAVGCATSEVNTKADSAEAEAAGTTDAARVGQPVTISGSEEGSKVQVTAVKVVDTTSTDRFFKVKKGKRLVAVQFKLVNVGTVPYNDAPSNGAKVVDSQGQQYEADIFFEGIAAGPTLPVDVSLAPENKALGFITFQIPVKAKVAQVQFAMDSGFGDTAQWDLK